MGSSAAASGREQPIDPKAAIYLLQHHTRRRILRVLIDREVPTSPKEAAGELGADLAHVSYHFRVLAEYEAVELVSTEFVRGAKKHFYRPNPRLVNDQLIQQMLTATERD
jgi:predicted ArsR family transcriptional regulator